MAEHRLAVATAAATFVLLAIGGLVHATGSSLACPDWPLCYGQFFPAMQGGVLFEHGHRLVALAVTVLTTALAVTVWRRRREAAPRAMAALAVGLVLFQASLGALTVVYKLPLLVSAGHLATSMAFFSLLVALAFRLRPPAQAAPLARAAPRLALLAALAVYLQIVLGALVRHAAAALACGRDLLLCQGALWPASGPSRLHMAHRLGAVVVAGLVLLAAVPAWRAARAAGRRGLAALAAAGPIIVAAQLGAGLWSVATLIAVPVVTLHLALGALLLAAELSLFLLTRPRAAPLPARAAGAAGLRPAPGVIPHA
ncbi:MAG TPA: COX15/CtaA family protein [Anaeromyxobacteraceae bacterium]|nr:COX15/CtaA family protein [Anaeromyxobacteraceae bacterium]